MAKTVERKPRTTRTKLEKLQDYFKDIKSEKEAEEQLVLVKENIKKLEEAGLDKTMPDAYNKQVKIVEKVEKIMTGITRNTNFANRLNKLMKADKPDLETFDKDLELFREAYLAKFGITEKKK